MSNEGSGGLQLFGVKTVQKEALRVVFYIELGFVKGSASTWLSIYHNERGGLSGIPSIGFGQAH